ncbi:MULTISPECIES: DUF896 domain-containing protein [Thermoactinomyces]|uniref:DUF896 domain-containing protein n=1 Tax=Thermoactinomyces intermedius TaxID=2024 RepID=A0A8I1DF00_THEIN|nr:MULTISPECIES: DUF896 domain-containing protein [Thermoactinomyces]MBH8595482.1 DUF896 domain-containing protein [Thermoactinomyces intermedius]MBH8601407.1 DUF896 domain-containing protein [Thermoactinomyces sp. CICC 23799]
MQKKNAGFDRGKKEQAKLYQIYLKVIRGQVKQQLSRVRFVDKPNHG